MKRIFFTYLFAIPVLFLWSQEAPSQKKASKLFGYQAIIGDYLHIMQEEVSNYEWNEYVWDIKRTKDTGLINKSLPDTLVWRDNLCYNEAYVNYYFQHPAYYHYPVVGISYNQALDYCNWLTGKLNSYLEIEKKLPYKKVLLRLPTEKEWELAARAGNKIAIYAWDGEKLFFPPENKKFCGQSRANFNGGFSTNRYTVADVTAPVSSYWPNTWDIFNMCGNVAEMIAEQGIAKGGAWNSAGADLRIDARIKYNKATSYIGFRPVLEVLEWNEKYKDHALTARVIEKMMALVPKRNLHIGPSDEDVPYYGKTESTDSFYIAKTETSNWLYNIFLEELKIKDTTLALKHRVQNENWKLESPYLYLRSYSKHARFAEYPVVNISYEAAIAFCDWLTKKYAALPDAKFKGALFTLPNEVQWEVAAQGKKDYYVFPWGGPNARNSKGNYLANFNPYEEQYIRKNEKNVWYLDYPEKDSTISRGIDGAILCAPVKSYFPNEYGLYNMAGNVTEMVRGNYSPYDYYIGFQEKKQSEQKTEGKLTLLKGGSFATQQYYLQISSRDFETVKRMEKLKLNALPDIGFRFVMLLPKNISNQKP